MSQNDLPTSSEQWAALVRAALEPGPAVSADDLLLVRDLVGRPVRRMEPPAGVAPRLGAVLLLLYPDSGELRLPLTVRSDLLPNHRGEVSLPGGATDPDDSGPAATALRECWEELGVTPHSLEVWGTLSSIYIPPSNFEITPVAAWSAEVPALTPNDAEVSAVLTVTLRELLDPELVLIEQWNLRGADVQVPFFAIAGHKVWGATALILSEFVARLRRATGMSERVSM
ncbi:MAG TPA: CoA pyrophosphatase [Roseiflexaceae bacterium]|nr:CoA pyrophosphatase [Roseiflexaceae bacterium]